MGTRHSTFPRCEVCARNPGTMAERCYTPRTAFSIVQRCSRVDRRAVDRPQIEGQDRMGIGLREHQTSSHRPVPPDGGWHDVRPIHQPIAACVGRSCRHTLAQPVRVDTDQLSRKKQPLRQKWKRKRPLAARWREAPLSPCWQQHLRVLLICMNFALRSHCASDRATLPDNSCCRVQLQKKKRRKIWSRSIFPALRGCSEVTYSPRCPDPAEIYRRRCSQMVNEPTRLLTENRTRWTAGS
jgi:hypothetical protein